MIFIFIYVTCVSVHQFVVQDVNMCAFIFNVKLSMRFWFFFLSTIFV